MLADGVVLHLMVGLVGEVALHQAPLVVSFFHILPVHPRCGHDVADVVHQFLGQFEVAGNSGTSVADLAHP